MCEPRAEERETMISVTMMTTTTVGGEVQMLGGRLTTEVVEWVGVTVKTTGTAVVVVVIRTAAAVLLVP